MTEAQTTAGAAAGRPRIGVVALDLDGTLLDSEKRLTDANREALREAAERGIEIVPATGRFFGLMPEAVRSLPFLHYAMTINGAQVYDIREDRPVYRAEIPVDEAVAIMRYLDTFPCIYDCYMDNDAWMTRAHMDICEMHAPDKHYVKMIRGARHPVDDLKTFIAAHGHDVQKVMLFTCHEDARQHIMQHIGELFPSLAVTTSVARNVEITNENARKGLALHKLAEYLGLPVEATMAVGDGLNDLEMVEAAGLGVAMENAVPEVKAVAQYITASCDADGVAEAVRRFCL